MSLGADASTLLLARNPAAGSSGLAGRNAAIFEGGTKPERVGPYRILEQLGEGGFGIVYRAEQSEPLRREVALKVIKPGMDSRQIVQRFDGERRTLALMEHPNIAGVLDAGTTDSGLPYFVMELVRGQPITEYCDENNLTIRQRLELFIPVCLAVHHAHQKAILHRDLKPSNILVAEVDGKPMPKVIDFGIAKALGSETADGTIEDRHLRTLDGAVIGTPQYMSPEQAGATPDLDTRSDIYALGVILYELLTGKPPLSCETLHQAAFDELLRLVREGEIKRPSSALSPITEATETVATHRSTTGRRLGETVKGELDWIVLRAVEKERSRRYDSAKSFADDILRFLRDEPVQASPPSRSYRLKKFLRRNKGPVAAAAAVILALAGGLAASLWQANRATKALGRESAARSETENALNRESSARLDTQRQLDRSQLEEGRAWLERARLAKEKGDNFTAIMLAGKALGFAGCGREQASSEFQSSIPLLLGAPLAANPAAESARLPEAKAAVELIAGTSPTMLPIWSSPLSAHHAGAVTCVAFSPDGTRLASGSGDKTVKLWDTATGKTFATLQGHSDFVLSVAFSPDGTRLASGSGGYKTVKLWDTATGKAIATQQGHIQDVFSVAFSPDGTRLASGSGDNTVKLWDTATGKAIVTLQGHLGDVFSVAFSPDGTRLASGSADNTVKLWDAATGKAIATLEGHFGDVFSVAFSPDGTRLASGSGDKTVKLWDAATGKAIATLMGHSSYVQSVAFSPDGTRLASGSGDRTVKLWDTVSDPQREGAAKMPDLLGLLRQGLFQMPAKEIVWNTNPSLFSALEFTPVHYRQDTQAKLANPILTPAERSTLRLQLVAGASNWRAELAIWQESVAAGLAEDSGLRREFLIHMATFAWLLGGAGDISSAAAATEAGLTEPASAGADESQSAPQADATASNSRGNSLARKAEIPPQIMTALAEYLRPGDFTNLRLSVATASAWRLWVKHPEWGTPELRQKLERAIKGAAPDGWLERVLDLARTKFLDMARAGNWKEALQAFRSWIEKGAPMRGEVMDVLRELNGLGAAAKDPEWIAALLDLEDLIGWKSADLLELAGALPTAELATKRRLFERVRSRNASMNNATANQGYAYGSYLEVVAGDSQAAQALYEEGRKLFPNEERLERYYALGQLYLGNAEAALEGYERAEAIVVSKKETGYLRWIRPGQAAALWKLERRDEAVEVCRKLAAAISDFKTVQAAKQWKMVTTANLPAPDMTPFYEALEEALRRHPELRGGEGK